MYIFISVLIIVVCVLLTLIVLVQNSKGGGLASNFSSSNQVMGVRKTTDFLEKATWTLSITVIVLSIVASLSIQRGEESNSRSVIENQIQNAVDPSQIPEFPTTLPQDPAAAGGDATSEQE